MRGLVRFLMVSVGLVAAQWMALPVGAAQNLAAGYAHTCAIAATDGSVACMGQNLDGQLGDGTTDDRLLPVTVIGLSGATALAAGDRHSCALLATGVVKCWGRNLNGQLGIGKASPNSTVPATVTFPLGTQNIVAITSGYAHSCAIGTFNGATGTVFCWGYNNKGQVDGITQSDKALPVVVSLSAGDTATSLALGITHTCARTTGGQMQCWGSNSYGELGRNTSGEGMGPAYVPKPVSLGGFSVPNGSQMLTAGYFHTCALVVVGGQRVAKCWGRNNNGQLGVGDFIDRPSPAAVTGSIGDLSQITAGSYHTCARTSDGVRCWGDNSQGEIGSGAFASFASPYFAASSDQFDSTTQLAAGSQHTCGLSLGAQGQRWLRCWGDNTYGQFGNETRGFVARPEKVALYSADGTIVQAAKVAAGDTHTCAITSSNEVQCWGDNRFGQIGDYSSGGIRPTPKSIATGSLIATIVTPGLNHTCATTISGHAQCWGSNTSGQIGDGTYANQLSPKAIDLANPASDIVINDQLSAGDSFTCAVANGGKVQCWGNNAGGQLGDGTNMSTNKAEAIALAGNGVQATKVLAGNYHACALTDGGVIQCWGGNQFGQLGRDTSLETAPYKPLPVTLSGTNSIAKGIAVGVAHTCALTVEGHVQCWGYNDTGGLGRDCATDCGIPKEVVGLGGIVVVSIVAGEQHTCALTDAGNVLCWGFQSGGLGNGNEQSSLPVVVSLEGGGGVKANAISARYNNTCVRIQQTNAIQCWGDNPYGQIGNGEHGYWPLMDAAVDIHDYLFHDKFESD